MTGYDELLLIIQSIFDIQAKLWRNVITQNIFLSVMVIISLVAMVVNLKNNTRQ